MQHTMKSLSVRLYAILTIVIAAFSVPLHADERGGSGACCLNGDVCYDTGSETCAIFGGVWFPGLTCSQVVCETNCGGDCSPGETEDCYGNCFPVAWIADGYCDNGQYQHDLEYIYLDCVEFGYDMGDCAEPPDLPVNLGACCIGNLASCDERVCQDLTYTDCIALDGQYVGENTQCQTETCLCPPGQIADCNGNCFPIYYLDDGLCHEGQGFPANGDDANSYYLSLECFELACDGGDCSGICGGACCLGGECMEDFSSEGCAEQGGTFLGGGETCVAVNCLNYLVPSYYSETLEGIGAYIADGHIGATLDVSGGFTAVSLNNCISVTNEPISVVNIYRGSEFIQSIIEFGSDDSPEVSMDGNTLVLTVNGMAYVYEYDGNYQFDYAGSFSLVSGEAATVSISGDRIVTTSGINSTVDIYEKSDKIWSLAQSIDDAIEWLYDAIVVGDTIVVQGVFELKILEPENSEQWASVYSFDFHGDRQDIDFDGQRVIIGETTDYYPGTPYVARAQILSRISGSWAYESTLVPVDVQGNDEYGDAVAISGDVACISSTHNDASGTLDSGAVSVFRFQNNEWVYSGRIFPVKSYESMSFGSTLSTDGDTVGIGWLRQYGGTSTEYRGAQSVSLSDYQWMNPSGGDIGNASNWSPSLPDAGSSAKISVPASFVVTSSGNFPFSNLNVGTSRPSFNLQGSDVVVGTPGNSSLIIAGSQSYTGKAFFNNGSVTFDDNIQVGLESRPGALSIGQTGTVITTDYSQAKTGELNIVLTDRDGSALQVSGDCSIRGTLNLLLPNTDNPPSVGTSWDLIHCDYVDTNEPNRFDIIVLPGISSAKYIEIAYVEDVGLTVTATVRDIADLLDLEDTDVVTVSGLATDLVIADIGSPSGVADGFDDIALSIGGQPGSVYVLVNDGAGEIGSQIIYGAGNGPSAIDAGDLDEDGTLDLVVTNKSDSTFFVLLNNGGSPDAMSMQNTESTDGLFPVDVKVMNIDNDGDNDIVIACQGDGSILPDGSIAGQLDFYDAQNNLAFGLSLAGTVMAQKPGKIDPGDVNNDKDFIISVSLRASNKVGRAARTSGMRGFDWSLQQEVSVGANPGPIAMGDLDDDGYVDVIVANTGASTVSVLMGLSDSTFDEEDVFEVGDEPAGIALLDYDGDLDLDLAVISNDDQGNRVVSVYRNDSSLNSGNGVTFSLEQVFDEYQSPLLIGSGTMDNDDADDLVSIVASPGFRGTENTTVILQSIPEGEVCLADFDSSNVVDVLDLLILIGAWGTADADLNGDGYTNVNDMLILIGAWGSCP